MLNSTPAQSVSPSGAGSAWRHALLTSTAVYRGLNSVSGGMRPIPFVQDTVDVCRWAVNTNTPRTTRAQQAVADQLKGFGLTWSRIVAGHHLFARTYGPPVWWLGQGVLLNRRRAARLVLGTVAEHVLRET